MKKMLIMLVMLLLFNYNHTTFLDNGNENNNKDFKLEREVDNTTEICEEETANFDIMYEVTEEVNDLGMLTIQVGTFREINGLMVEILDKKNAQVYITPDEHKHYGDCDVAIKKIIIDDINGDELDDITIIYSSYIGAGYLGGLEFDRSYVLLQTDNSFVFDEEQHELGNENHINTDYSNVQFYYDKHDWNNTLYTIENTELNIKNEYVDITANYPYIESNYVGLQNHTNEIIEYYIDGILYDFNDVDDFITMDISYEVTRSDRFLSVKYDVYWYVDKAYPNIELYTINIDLETGAIVNNFDISKEH